MMLATKPRTPERTLWPEGWAVDRAPSEPAEDPPTERRTSQRQADEPELGSEYYLG